MEERYKNLIEMVSHHLRHKKKFKNNNLQLLPLREIKCHINLKLEELNQVVVVPV
jgi:hypothetical protein